MEGRHLPAIWETGHSTSVALECPAKTPRWWHSMHELAASVSEAWDGSSDDHYMFVCLICGCKLSELTTLSPRIAMLVLPPEFHRAQRSVKSAASRWISCSSVTSLCNKIKAAIFRAVRNVSSYFEKKNLKVQVRLGKWSHNALTSSRLCLHVSPTQWYGRPASRQVCLSCRRSEPM